MAKIFYAYPELYENVPISIIPKARAEKIKVFIKSLT
jgi:hypothetical protein